MTHRSPETVKPPDDERISTSHTFLATRKPWSIRFGTGEFVAEDLLAFDAVIQKRINANRLVLLSIHLFGLMDTAYPSSSRMNQVRASIDGAKGRAHQVDYEGRKN